MGVFILSKKGVGVGALKRLLTAEPQNVNGQFTIRSEYYRKYLAKMLKGLFNITFNSSLLWDVDYIKDALLDGAIGVFESDIYGLVAYYPRPYGVNFYQRPSNVNYINQFISISKTIGVDTEIVYIYDDVDYSSVWEMIDIYAQRLANIDASIDCNLINTRVVTVFEVETQAQLAAAEKMYDNISNAKPVAFLRKDNTLTAHNELKFYQIDCNKTYIADKLQQEKRAVINEFLTSWGINNTNFEKRERLIADEVNSNNGEIMANVQLVKDNLRTGCDRVNKMFPKADLNIELRSFLGGNGRSIIESNNGQTIGKAVESNDIE
ncbi:MAG TPA: hypothetical protein DEB74_06000 [Lachnospiraceae bacterium]|nr:hypothetical protein [Lachnospiraceae bacterium]